MTALWLQEDAILHAVEHLDEGLDHVRGGPSAPVVLEYGDYECEHSRQAFAALERLESTRHDGLRHAFRHFPQTMIHRRALAAAAAAEAAAFQGRFWEMHALLFNEGCFLDNELRAYASAVGLDLQRFERDRVGAEVRARVRRDVAVANASGEVHGTPTLFLNGKIHRGGCDDESLLRALEG
jgi:protein-disulfide isomerase